MTEQDRVAAVEKVARAICAARYAGMSASLWDAITESEKEHYRREARAAIEAMKDSPPSVPRV